jgi:hypothetical protein
MGLDQIPERKQWWLPRSRPDQRRKTVLPTHYRILAAQNPGSQGRRRQAQIMGRLSKIIGGQVPMISRGGFPLAGTHANIIRKHAAKCQPLPRARSLGGTTGTTYSRAADGDDAVADDPFVARPWSCRLGRAHEFSQVIEGCG